MSTETQEKIEAIFCAERKLLALVADVFDAEDRDLHLVVSWLENVVEKAVYRAALQGRG